MHARRVAGLLCLIALGACGGGGSGGGSEIRTDVDTDPDGNSGQSPDGALLGDTDVSGQVLDAVTGVSIPGVDVRLMRSVASGDGAAGSAAAMTTTLSDGRYAFENLPAADDYVVAFDVDGYRNETYAGIVLDESGDAMLEPARLVSDDNAGTGQLAGLVGDAAGGPGLANLTLDFREGINRRTGEVIATARTAADGSYQVDGIGYGNVTAEIGGEGIRTSYATFQVLGNMLRAGQDVTVSAVDVGDEPVDVGEPVDMGSLRIVLTWDERPADLDANLTGPEADGQSYFRVFSGDVEDGPARLVDDVSTGFGPEIIELDRQEPGAHRYSVFNFSFSADDNRALERSGARVEVFSGDMSMAEFTVPAGVGDLWTVFDLVDGQIVTVNTVTLRQNILDHFPPQGRALAFEAAIASGAILPGADGFR